MKACIVLSLVICVVSSLPTKSEWQIFKETYGKQYLTTAEDDVRHHIFSRNLQKIKEHNKQYELGLTSYKMAVNKFSDWTEAEFKKILGVKPYPDSDLLSTDVSYQEEWHNFKMAFKRVYTKVEDEFRFKIFSKNLAVILKHNEDYKKGLTTFKMGVNNFSDMTTEEIKKLMGTHVLPHQPMKPSGEQKDCASEWVKFKNNYARIFTQSEDKMRLTIFCNNFHKIQKHNEDYEKGLTTFKMAVNKFADRTAEEMKKMMGYIKPNNSAPTKTRDVCEKQYTEFKNTYNKVYHGLSDDVYHMKIFCKNVKMIKEHNEKYAKGLTTFEMAVNRFTDMTDDEIRQYMGVLPTNHSVSVFSVLPQQTCETEWKKFKETYTKLYKSQDEEKKRHDVFCNNLDKILAHNELFKHGSSSYKQTVNKFTDLTADEFKELLNHGL